MKKIYNFIFCLIIFLGSSLIPVAAQQKEDESFYVAEKAFNDGFYDASITLFEKFIRDFPQSEKSSKARLYIARSLFSRKKFPGALKILNELLKDETAFPQAGQVYYWLGQVYFEGKNYNQALQYALKAINDYPESETYWWSHYLAGECYLGISDFESALHFFKTITEKSSDTVIVKKALFRLQELYYSREQLSEIISLTDRYLPGIEDRNEKARLLLYKGEAYFGKNDIEKALKILREGLSLTDEAEIKDVFYQRIGDCLLAQGEEIKAKESFDRISAEDIKQFSYANYYLRIKNYDKVFEITEQYLAVFPSSRYAPHMLLNKADSLYEMGRIKDALFFYKDILNAFSAPEYKNILDKAHYGLAWCYLKLGEFKNAIDEFKKTLKYTDNPVVRISSEIQIADAYQEKEMYDLALETYNRVLQQYPGNIYADYIQFQIGMLYLKNNNQSEAILSFRNLAKNFPSSKLVPESEYYLAASYFSEQAYQSARDILQGFLNKFSKHPLREKVLYLYAKCYFNEGCYEESLQALNAVINESKDRELQQLVYIDKAYAYLNLSRYDEARQTFDEFIKNFPRSHYLPLILGKLGALHEREKNYSEAEKYYSRIIDEYTDQPPYYDALNSLAHIYWEQNRPDLAKQYFERLMKSNNKKTADRAGLYYAEIIAQEQKIDEAFAIFDRIGESSDSLGGLAYAKKGFLLKEIMEYERAAAALRQAIEKGLDDLSVHFALGYCLEKLGRDDDALNEYFKIVYLFDDRENKAKAYFRAARIYERQNNRQEAKNIYLKIAELNVDESKIAREKIQEMEKIK